mgnify:CR=1 FL=1
MKASQSKVILYSFYRSSSAWRVRNVLNYKGIKYEYAAIDLLKGDQDNPEYEKLNPLKRAPVLIIDGQILIESLPIMEYLDETRPEKRIYPVDPVLRQQVRTICEIINSGIQPMQNTTFMDKIEKWFKQDPTPFVVHLNHEGFKILEKMLSKTAGRYCFGDEITAADCVLVPQVYGSAKRFGFGLTEYPIMEKIMNNLLEVQAFKDALPAAQPDYPGDQKLKQ